MLEGFERLERVAADANEAGGSILDRLPQRRKANMLSRLRRGDRQHPPRCAHCWPGWQPGFPQVALAWADRGYASAIDDGLIGRAKDR